MELNNITYSSDEITRLYTFKTDDNFEIQAVLVRRSTKNIICFPTQIGCQFQCNICNSGRFKRNVEYDELMYIIETLKFEIFNCNPIILSAMGTGEPTYNPFFIDILKEYKKNRFAFSTLVPHIPSFISIVDRIIKNKINCKIQLSLHGIGYWVRMRIFGDSGGLGNILRALYYLEKIKYPTDKIEINYALIDGVNDRPIDAFNLSNPFRKYKIKLNRFNEIEKNNLKPSTNTEKFKDYLKEYKVDFEEYATDGVDIQAACGQMTSGL